MRISLIGAAVVAVVSTTIAEAQVCSSPAWNQTGQTTSSCSSSAFAHHTVTHQRDYTVWGHVVCPQGTPTHDFDHRSTSLSGRAACGNPMIPNPQCPPEWGSPQTVNQAQWQVSVTHKAWSYTLGNCVNDGSSTNTQYIGTWGCTQSPCPSCLPNGTSCSFPEECCTAYCADPAYECGNPSPILINLKNNTSNYHLTSALDGVRFDIDADGDRDNVSWTEADPEVAFLVLDRNGNGTIDNASELFGTETLTSTGQPASNGFEALFDLDGGSTASDQKVDSSDLHYAQLRLWLDRNHNGISEPAELITLEDAGVTAIFTTYRETPRTDKNGNAYRYVGEALMRQNGQTVPRKVFDVFLKMMPS